MTISLLNQTSWPAKAIRDAMTVTKGTLDEPVDETKNKQRFLNLAKLGHWSPFEHASFTFLIEGVSRVTQQQLTRHRMASFSIESQRHVKVDELELVAPWTVRSNDEAVAVWNAVAPQAFAAYNKLIELGVPMQDARYILPQGVAGKILMTMNVRELYHFFKLRTAPAAQWEIRELAKEMFNTLHDTWPDIFNMEIFAYAE